MAEEGNAAAAARARVHRLEGGRKEWGVVDIAF